nr:hypothetical protein HanHA300_Chr09g0306271 [Helianthus annuus]KAJ0541307.1 hypothetical protein HanHA89_Chr09g0326941 [Helianthus annuus]KAJ0706386.1 hypothetical protein HanLR1_Chr09g0306411 [Helianthus annuus]KAJ0886920.1 hypothetical protein HanRHA438_Chr09g0384881 [Helianthus annuus]
MAQHAPAAKLVRQRWGSSSEGGEHSHGEECIRQVVYSPGAYCIPQAGVLALRVACPASGCTRVTELLARGNVWQVTRAG